MAKLRPVKAMSVRELSRVITRSPPEIGVFAVASTHCAFCDWSRLRFSPTCPSTRSMRAACGISLADAVRSYLVKSRAATAAIIAPAMIISVPCGQNFILSIKATSLAQVKSPLYESFFS